MRSVRIIDINPKPPAPPAIPAGTPVKRILMPPMPDYTPSAGSSPVSPARQPHADSPAHIKAKAKARMHAKAKAQAKRSDGARTRASGLATLAASDKEWGTDWAPSEDVVSAAAAAATAAAAAAEKSGTGYAGDTDCSDIDNHGNYGSGDAEEKRANAKKHDVDLDQSIADAADKVLAAAITFTDSFYEGHNEPEFFAKGTVDLDVF